MRRSSAPGVITGIEAEWRPYIGIKSKCNESIRTNQPHWDNAGGATTGVQIGQEIGKITIFEDFYQIFTVQNVDEALLPGSLWGLRLNGAHI